MFAPLTSRGGLVATTSIVAVGFVMILPQTREIFVPPTGIKVDLGEAQFRETPAEIGADGRVERTLNAPAVVEEAEREADMAPQAELGLLADSNDQIARALGLSINTVKFHLRNLYDKLAIKNRAQAVAFYYSTTRES